jgi:hypothetical protein
LAATLQLARVQARPPELRRGIFEVSVDGNSIGSIANHDIFETQIAAGHHTLRLRKGRYTSRQLSFEASDGDTVTFRCHGARIWPTWLLSFALPSMAISLTQE